MTDATNEARSRVVIRTEDLDDETLDAILNAEVSERSEALNYLMDEDTINAIANAQPGERSKEAGRRLEQS